MIQKRTLSILIVLVLILVPTTVTFASDNYINLGYNSRGEKVTKLQQELQDQGYLKDSVDGIYGLLTEQAVVDFQKDKGLSIDGIAGVDTKTALYGKSNSDSQGTSSSDGYTKDDEFWLARIIEAEAGGEPYNGKVAVGNVILNRVSSKEFPNSIYDVIFEYYGSIPQFSPVADGSIYNDPSDDSIKAAKAAINGERPVGDSTYFFNQSKAAGTWIVQNKTYLTKIGGHSFYN